MIRCHYSPTVTIDLMTNFVSGKRDPQRGNSIVLALIVLTTLGTLAMLTVFSVRGGIRTAAADRFHATALYAAESGAAVAMDYLRSQPTWSGFINPSNNPTPVPAAWAAIYGNGDGNNAFTSDTGASYAIQIFNNHSDTGFVAGADNDHRVIIRATGFGPDGATAVIEWDVSGGSGSTQSTPCNEYSQGQLSEGGGGNNGCLSTITGGAGNTQTTKPGG